MIGARTVARWIMSIPRLQMLSKLPAAEVCTMQSRLLCTIIWNLMWLITEARVVLYRDMKMNSQLVLTDVQ